MLKDLKYLFAYTVPVSAFISFQSTGWVTYSAVFYAFLIIPILDLIAGETSDNLSDEVASLFDDFMIKPINPLSFLTKLKKWFTINPKEQTISYFIVEEYSVKFSLEIVSYSIFFFLKLFIISSKDLFS